MGRYRPVYFTDLRWEGDTRRPDKYVLLLFLYQRNEDKETVTLSSSTDFGLCDRGACTGSEKVSEWDNSLFFRWQRYNCGGHCYSIDLTDQKKVTLGPNCPHRDTDFLYLPFLTFPFFCFHFSEERTVPFVFIRWNYLFPLTDGDIDLFLDNYQTLW